MPLAYILPFGRFHSDVASQPVYQPKVMTSDFRSSVTELPAIIVPPMSSEEWSGGFRLCAQWGPCVITLITLSLFTRLSSCLYVWSADLETITLDWWSDVWHWGSKSSWVASALHSEYGGIVGHMERSSVHDVCWAASWASGNTLARFCNLDATSTPAVRSVLSASRQNSPLIECSGSPVV